MPRSRRKGTKAARPASSRSLNLGPVDVAMRLRYGREALTDIQHREPQLPRNAAIRSLRTATAASPIRAKGAYQSSGNPVSCWASRIPTRKLRAP
jgi:hypothetical protein